LQDNVPKCSAAQQAADCNIIGNREMRFTCWIHKARDSHSDYVIRISFHANNVYANAPLWYLICTLSLLFSSTLTQQSISL